MMTLQNMYTTVLFLHENAFESAGIDPSLSDYTLALYKEVGEIANSFASSPWEIRETDYENLSREIVDCMFFLLHIARAAGLSANDLENMFHKVLARNYKKYETGKRVKKGGE
jgi:NTP pyrophosphatase (non-canonical NTP hydrolase)